MNTQVRGIYLFIGYSIDPFYTHIRFSYDLYRMKTLLWTVLMYHKKLEESDRGGRWNTMGKPWREVKAIAGNKVCWSCFWRPCVPEWINRNWLDLYLHVRPTVSRTKLLGGRRWKHGGGCLYELYTGRIDTGNGWMQGSLILNPAKMAVIS